jgi:hypothetical protein
MPKSLVISRLSPQVLKARAGLIPASDDIENELEARVAHVRRSVRAYGKLNSDRDDLAIIDILQDLRHYCDSKALVFDELDGTAREYYQEYVDESPWISRLG